MVMGKRAETNGIVQDTKQKRKRAKKEFIEEQQIVEEPILEDNEPTQIGEEEDESESFKKVLSEFKEDGGWVHIKKKKDGKIVKIGKYRPNDFDKDEIAKEYGGGTYYYDLRDNNGRIRAKSEETYIDKKEPEKTQSNEFLQMATIIKEQTKEIEALKSELLKPKQEDTAQQNMIVELIKENQRNQVEMLKAIATSQTNHNPQPTSMTEMLTAITTIMTLINKQQPQPQPEQPKNSISDLVELAGLFADMKSNGEPPKQETIMDIVKTFLTDGSLANVIAMLKAPKPPIVSSPTKQVQLQQPQKVETAQQPQQEQANNEKAIIQEFFRQYEKQLFKLKVDGGNAEYIANTIIPFFDLNNEFKMIGYNYFKDIDSAYNGLLEVAVDFKNEQDLLKGIVELIHNYFDYNDTKEGETANE